MTDTSPIPFPLQPRRSFKGDQEAHIDRLVAACQKHEVGTAEIKERPLVPFFDTSSDPSAFKSLEQFSSMGIKKENASSKLKHSKSTDGKQQQQQQQGKKKKKAAQHQHRSNSAYAGPAFTISPTPDSLPIPTSSLLL
jgi:hypothetical protein